MQNKLPKFEVGEVVVLVDAQHPKYNGEYEILWLGECEDKVFINKVGEHRVLKLPDGFVYDLGVINEEGVLMYAHETELRKKHLPSTESYETLMASLKLGQPVRV